MSKEEIYASQGFHFFRLWKIFLRVYLVKPAKKLPGQIALKTSFFLSN